VFSEQIGRLADAAYYSSVQYGSFVQMLFHFIRFVFQPASNGLTGNTKDSSSQELFL
jgi:hypothetical protein